MSKIEGIGAETKTKLHDLPTYWPQYSKPVQVVGDLLELISHVQADESQRARLMKALKMNKVNPGAPL